MVVAGIQKDVVWAMNARVGYDIGNRACLGE